jgi:hypothetical protein
MMHRFKLEGIHDRGSRDCDCPPEYVHRCEFLEDAHQVVLSAAPAHARRILPLRSASKDRSITASAAGSSPPSNSSTLSNKRTFWGKPGQIAARLAHSDLGILDEVGYLPFSASGGALLFHLLSKLYDRTSVTISSFGE